LAKAEALQLCLKRFNLTIEDLYSIKEEKEQVDPELLVRLARFFGFLSKHFLHFVDKPDQEELSIEESNCRLIVFSSLARSLGQYSTLKFRRILRKVKNDLDNDYSNRNSEVISKMIGRLMARYQGSSKGIGPGKMEEALENYIFIYSLFLYLRSFSHPLRSFEDSDSSDQRAIMIETISLVNSFLQGNGLPASSRLYSRNVI
jgi:hypothetical protein